MTLKKKIHTHYLNLVNERIRRLQQSLADLKEAGAGETKSTAGDKHETALAMIQIEQEQVRSQLKEATAQLALLEKTDPALSNLQVTNGSLVTTNKGIFYISVALGKAVVDDVTVIALSPQSPLGSRLLKLIVKDTVEINNHRYVIESIA